MDVIKILVVEDELIIAMGICDSLKKVGYKDVKSVNNCEKAFDFLRNEKPDIAILDIDLKDEKDGIDIASYIHNTINIPYIFLTSIQDSRTFDKAKAVNPSAYLIKPFSNDDLYRSIELALANFNNKDKTDSEYSDSTKDESFIVKCNNLFTKINYNDILIAKSEHVYIELMTIDGSTHLLRSPMKKLQEVLPNNFIRVHRSYIINSKYINTVNRQSVDINGNIVPIGRSYLKSLSFKY